MTYEDNLIALTEVPTGPMPWVTSEPGDAYVWGDYVMLYQVRPPTIADGVATIAAFVRKDVKGLGQFRSSPMTYLYSLTVLYRRQVYPSARPVRLFGLEQLDRTKVPPEHRALVSDNMPPMIGEFRKGSHLNYGAYAGKPTYEAVRKALLECARASLDLTGEPERIGTVADAKGHPKTGIAKESAANATTPKAGCLACISVLLGAGVLACNLLH